MLIILKTNNLGTTDHYTYNSKGNLATRNGPTLVWDVQNHLQAVKNGRTIEESYLYDDSGQRVKKTSNGVTTYYVNQFYEVSGGTVTKYYYFGGQRIAMKRGSTLTYLHADHLGSTVLETNTSGNATADQQYFAYGRQRDVEPVVTEHKFTRQKIDGTDLQYFTVRDLQTYCVYGKQRSGTNCTSGQRDP